MIPYRLKIKPLITTSALGSIFIFAIILLVLHIADFKKLGEILIHYALILLPITILWFILEKKGWHWKYIQKYRTIVNIPPDFRGRWIGTLDRDGEEDPHTFVIEITQSMSKAQVYTYSRNGKSQSYLVEISSDLAEQKFWICYLWQGDGGKIEKRKIPAATFYGFTILELFEKESPKRLEGYYFTNREPKQTKGVIKVLQDSEELKNKFE
ncbi:MAG: hypothetical protein IPO86_00135 [Saprospiraceae bacterium]|nr:hypothetical protein [Saprospiraceae bacterium]